MLSSDWFTVFTVTPVHRIVHVSVLQGTVHYCATLFVGPRPSHYVMSESDSLDHAERPPAYFMVATGEGLSEGYEHGGPGVCLGDGRTDAEGVP